MPTYSYACTACDHRFETQQSFTDAALTECPECQGRLRKLFNSVGIVFKGSGFYRTDSRGADPAKASETATTGSSSKEAAATGTGGKSSGSTDSSTAAAAGSKSGEAGAGKGTSGGSGKTSPTGSKAVSGSAA